MFWEGRFDGGQNFELELKLGTVILTVSEKEIIIGHVSDFPNVDDVVFEFKDWVRNNPEDLNNI